MKPVRFDEVNITFAKDQPPYIPLPAYKAYDREGRVISCWQLSLRERFRLLLTGRLWLHQLTFNDPLQPQRPSTEKPHMPRLTIIGDQAKAA